MKVEIPDEMAKMIGIAKLNEEDIVFETTELAWRSPESVVNDGNCQGIVIYAKNSEQD